MKEEIYTVWGNRVDGYNPSKKIPVKFQQTPGTYPRPRYPKIQMWFRIWVFPKIMVPQNGWFIRETPIKMDDLGVPLFLETPISKP